MTLQELKKMIESEVSALVGSTLTEPELPKKVVAPVKKKAELSEEELEDFMFHGKKKVDDVEKGEVSRKTSHL
jgi:hypothetical protein